MGVAELTYRDAVARGIAQEMARDENVVFLGEDVAKAAYRSALEKTDLPAEIRTVVQKQYDGVLRNHDEVRNLRDRFKATAH